MREFFAKLLGLLGAWGALFLFWNHRATAIPTARAWISNPLIQLKATVDQKLSQEERLLLSYYLPKIYPVPYVCGEYNLRNELTGSFIPGDTYKIQVKKDETKVLRCGSGMRILPNGDYEFLLTRANVMPAFEPKSGVFSWTTNAAFSLVFSYLTAEIKSSAPLGQGALMKLADRFAFLANTPTTVNLRRAHLPNFSSMPLYLQSGGQPVFVNDGNVQFELKGADQAFITAVSIRRFAELKK